MEMQKAIIKKYPLSLTFKVLTAIIVIFKDNKILKIKLSEKAPEADLLVFLEKLKKARKDLELNFWLKETRILKKKSKTRIKLLKKCNKKIASLDKESLKLKNSVSFCKKNTKTQQ
jgi:GTP cyclohydrolase II